MPGDPVIYRDPDTGRSLHGVVVSCPTTESGKIRIKLTDGRALRTDKLTLGVHTLTHRDTEDER